MASRITRRELGALSAGTVLGAVTGQIGVAGAATGLSAGTAPAGGLAELYSRCDATDLAELVRRRVVSPRELLEEAIRRTEALNPQLNAVTQKHYAHARAAADAATAGGPLAGVPFLLKDLGAQLAGTVTSGGSRSLMGVDAPATNTIVQRHLQAGLNVFGKTNVPEFGMAFTTESTALGSCHNPWNLGHTPAGSSGGSAAAVAAGIVPMAHGTDGGGSIRVPAAACGVFGLKPTRLRTPRGPGGALGPSAMSVGHVLSRTVRDSALMLDLTAGYEAGAPFAAPGANEGFAATLQRPPGPQRIAIDLDEQRVALDPQCKQAVLSMAKVLQDLGHHVEEASPGLDFEAINGAQTWLVMAEFSHGMHGLANALGEPVESMGLEPLSLEFVRHGAELKASDYIAHTQSCYTAGAQMAAWQADYDLVLQPVTATLPPPLGVLNYQPQDTPYSFVDRFRLYAAYTYLYNLTGQPSAAVPAGISREGLPLSVMLSGRNGEDARVLSLCAQLETAAPWFARRPPVSA